MEQALYHSFSPASASATRVRWNMLSSTAQYLSARQTMMASRQVGTWRKVRGHIWLEMMFCSFLVMAKQRSALTQAEPPMTFVDGILTVTLPVDENTKQMFGVAKLTDGTLLFELVQGDTTMDFLMEAVPEDAEPAAAE